MPEILYFCTVLHEKKIFMSELNIKSDREKKGTKRLGKEALDDFKIACVSRQASLMGRKEVLTGKAKFGIFGAGKELPQLAMARVFQKGDFRSGYYRDQTFMLALGLATVEQLYAQLYAHADPAFEPFSAGRQMNSHFATPLVDEKGEWTDHVDLYNVTADISPTAGQMARSLGIALASKKYRQSKASLSNRLSNDGNEVSFVTIGDASTSEGVFWETLNAAAVMQVPLACFVWDDGYGISVPKEFQTTKGSISEALAGFHPSNDEEKGLDIYKVKAWDYNSMRNIFEKGIDKARKTHRPCLFHVEECTQPQGHSTSGSHERYKDADRLAFEKEWDGIRQMRLWLVKEGFATDEILDEIEKEAKKEVRASIRKAWQDFNEPIKQLKTELIQVLAPNDQVVKDFPVIEDVINQLNTSLDPTHKDIIKHARSARRKLDQNTYPYYNELVAWINTKKKEYETLYTSHLFSETSKSALNVQRVEPEYTDAAASVNGYEILNACFDHHLQSNPSIFAFGEDVGYIGDVNQGFAGMQEKHGIHRVFDTGIREWTIMGQAIGMSMRGLRPIAEIQYLDYLIYSLPALSDDLATVRYRSNATQAAPAIIRTRGHRLEGIWHSGSPIGLLLNSLKGICLLVPRNMTQAAGFYNTMLASDDPALIIECLNGYRLKEKLPSNVGTFKLPIGQCEVLAEGTDVTLVTYGSCVRIAQQACQLLQDYNISVELIDIQSLMPFDLDDTILKSLKKTSRILFLDEDFHGGATAFMMNEVLSKRDGYRWLDAKPTTLCAKDVRSPYGSDGDYFIKPSIDDVFETIYSIMHEADPGQFNTSF